MTELEGLGFGKNAVVVTGRDSHGEITGMGVGRGDMFTHQFGSLMSAILRAAVTSTSTIVLNDQTNTARSLIIYSSLGASSAFNDGLVSPLGGHVAVGTSVVAPTRGDVDLGGLVGTLTPFAFTEYMVGSAVISAAAVLQMPTALTINEIGIYGRLFASAVGMTTILLAHDAISPGVAIPTAGMATVAWTVQL